MKKLFPDPFLKNQNWASLWIDSLKFYVVVAFVCFFCFVCFFEYQAEGCRYILKLSCRPLVTLSYFVHDFWGKIFLLLHSINWPNLLVWLPLLGEILGNMCIVIVCWPGCAVINFEINLMFLIKPFFLHDPKVKTKIWRTKRAFNLK